MGGGCCKTVEPLKAILFSALLFSFLLISTAFISCAGGAGSPKGSEAEGTALAVRLPDTSRAADNKYAKEDIISFTVTVSSGSFTGTKTASKGETMIFSNLPAGTYSVKAYGKTSNGNIAAKCETSVKIVAGETTTTTLHLSRLEYCTVKFFNGTTEVSSVQVTNGYTVAKPANPTKDGHTFSFWGASNDADTSFDFNSSITADTNLYAIFDVITYDITFDYNGGAIGGAPSTVLQVAYGSVPDMTKVADPSRVDSVKGTYEFLGWAETADAETATGASAAVTGEKTYYAVWKPKYKITFDYKDGTDGTASSKVVYVDKGATIAMPTAPTKTGWTLAGWYTSTDGGTTLADTAFDFAETEITENITLYAKWVLDISGLSGYLASLPTGSKESPNVLPAITGLTTSNWTQIKTALRANSSKFVDLSATTLPEGITSMSQGFYECSNLVAAPIIPAGVTDMYQCFLLCSSLTATPAIPDGVTNMSGCFAGSSLTTAPAIPDSVTNMTSCFNGCHSLTTAPAIPDSVTNMDSCFYECSRLTAAPAIPDRVTNMQCCFYRCRSLTTAPAIPDGVTNMTSCFNGCSSLTTAPAIPDGVTDMQYCFLLCRSLTTAPAIPSGVTDMRSCFKGCSSLTGEIVINAEITDTDYWEGAFTDVPSTVTLKVKSEGVIEAIKVKNTQFTDENFVIIP